MSGSSVWIGLMIIPCWIITKALLYPTDDQCSGPSLYSAVTYSLTDNLYYLLHAELLSQHGHIVSYFCTMHSMMYRHGMVL